MHYCFLTTGTWLGNGGLERLSRLGGALITLGVRVSYIVDDVPANRQDLDVPPGATVEYVPVGTSLTTETRARRAAIRRLSPDFVHLLLPAVKTHLALRGVPNVRVVGDWDEWRAIRGGALHRRLLEQWLDRWLRRRASLVVVASAFMRDEFLRRYNIRALYLPHSGYLTQVPPDGSSPYDRPTAVYMGTLYHVYDHDILFRAAELLKSRHAPREAPAIEIIGEGPEMSQWKQFVCDRQLDQVRMPGSLRGDELWRRLRHAHVLLFPLRDSPVNRSRCPGKVFYYAQARRPVIATRVGELLNVFGDAATYVTCDATAFADAIDHAASQPRLPDIDYRMGTWHDRAITLLDALNSLPSREREGSSAQALTQTGNQ